MKTLKDIWNKLHKTNFIKFFTEKRIRIIITIIIILTVICIITLWVAKSSVDKYSKGFARQEALDSIKVENSKVIEENRIKDSVIWSNVIKLERADSFFSIDLFNNRKELELFKQQEYEINKIIYHINNSNDIGSRELQREYANFK